MLSVVLNNRILALVHVCVLYHIKCKTILGLWRKTIYIHALFGSNNLPKQKSAAFCNFFNETEKIGSSVSLQVYLVTLIRLQWDELHDESYYSLCLSSCPHTSKSLWNVSKTWKLVNAEILSNEMLLFWWGWNIFTSFDLCSRSKSF